MEIFIISVSDTHTHHVSFQHWRTDVCKLCCWRRLLRVAWITRRSKLSILKAINSEYSLEELMLKLRLKYFGHLVWRTNSLGKILMLERLRVGGEGGNRGWDGWMASPTQWIWVWANSGRQGKPSVLESMGLQSQAWLSNSTTTLFYHRTKWRKEYTCFKYMKDFFLYWPFSATHNSPVDKIATYPFHA